MGTKSSGTLGIEHITLKCGQKDHYIIDPELFFQDLRVPYIYFQRKHLVYTMQRDSVRTENQVGESLLFANWVWYNLTEERGICISLVLFPIWNLSRTLWLSSILPTELIPTLCVKAMVCASVGRNWSFTEWEPHASWFILLRLRILSPRWKD